MTEVVIILTRSFEGRLSRFWSSCTLTLSTNLKQKCYKMMCVKESERET